ncbi:MAG: radical SAM protein [Nitrospinae bacterium]|nr:radical SAM protein [Nitrospinota bacterium]
MKKILFANANIYSQVRDAYRPLWPGYLSAYLEKHMGEGHFEFRYMTGDFGKDLEEFKPDIVAISSTSSNYNCAMRYAAAAKARGCAVVIGGIHITYMPQCLTKDMDVGVVGEGEITFLELMRHYLERNAFDPEHLGGISGLVYNHGGKLVRTSPRPLIASLDEVPSPKRSILGYGSQVYMFTSRGCPYECTFCVSARYWDKVRYVPVGQVIEEIRELVDHGVEVIHFFDDLFVSNRKRLRQIADEVVANGFHKKASFICYARANVVTPDMAKSLRDMNAISVGVGFESGSDRVLKYLKGSNMSVEDNWRAVKILKEAGLRALDNFMIGSPDETKEEIMQTYDFIAKSGVDSIDVAIITPYPGTPLWNYAKNRGLVSDNMNWDLLNNTDSHGGGVFISEKLTRKEIDALYKKFVKLNFIVKVKSLRHYPYSMTRLAKVAFRFMLRNYRLLLSS